MAKQQTMPGVEEVPTRWYKCTLNYIASNGLIRSTSIGVEAQNDVQARTRAHHIAQRNGWNRPTVSKIVELPDEPAE